MLSPVRNFNTNFYTSSFCGNIAKEKTLSPEDILKKIYGDNIKIRNTKRRDVPNSFTIYTFEGFYRKSGEGTYIFGKDDKLESITVQETNRSDLIGPIKIYDAQGKIIKSLTKEQAKSLRFYRGNMANNLNNMLRLGQINSLFKNDVEVLDSLFEDKNVPKVAQTDMVVYRGISIDERNCDFWNKNIVPRNEFIEKGFMSTTKDRKRAESYGNAILHIEIPKGTKYLDMYQLLSPIEWYLPEEELLFNRNTKLFIKGYDSGVIYAKLVS